MIREENIRYRLDMKSLTSKLYYSAGILMIAGYLLKTMAAKPWELTQTICEVLDKDFFIVKQCALTKNAEGRTVWNSRVQPLQKLENIFMKINMFRKFGKKYRPFYIETTIDFCNFLKNYKSLIPWGLMYGTVTKYTNMNHTCPYDLSDLIVKNYELPLEGLSVIPMPKGTYLLDVLFIADKEPKIKFKLFFAKYK